MTNWGIIGCANIARKNIRAIILAQTATKNSERANGKVVLSAVASRDLKKVETYVKHLKLLNIIPVDQDVKLCGNYDDLINDQDIDAVYIPLPTTLHLEWAIKAAERGKHILLEKPSTVDCSELLQIIYTCGKHNVVFMDGVMFMHHKRMQYLFKHLNDPFCGDVQKIVSAFSFNGTNSDFFATDIRTKVDGDLLGAMGDLGWYCIRLALLVFNKGNDMLLRQKGFMWPKECKSVCNKWNNEGVPLDCETTVFFGTDDEHNIDKWKKIVFECSFCLPFRESYEILITSNSSSNSNFTCDKVIRCNDFVIPRNPYNSSFTVETFPSIGPLGDFDTKVISNIQTIDVIDDNDQEVNMFLEFNRIISENDTNSKDYYKMISLLTQSVIDSCMTSMKLEGKIVPIDISSVRSFLK